MADCGRSRISRLRGAGMRSGDRECVLSSPRKLGLHKPVAPRTPSPEDDIQSPAAKTTTGPLWPIRVSCTRRDVVRDGHAVRVGSARIFRMILRLRAELTDKVASLRARGTVNAVSGRRLPIAGRHIQAWRLFRPSKRGVSGGMPSARGAPP